MSTKIRPIVFRVTEPPTPPVETIEPDNIYDGNQSEFNGPYTGSSKISYNKTYQIVFPQDNTIVYISVISGSTWAPTSVTDHVTQFKLSDYISESTWNDTGILNISLWDQNLNKVNLPVNLIEIG